MSKKKKKKATTRAEEVAADRDTTADGYNDEEEELENAALLTETAVQRRMAELFEITRLNGKYGITESGKEMLAAQLRLIEDYISLAKIKADLTEAQLYLKAAEIENL